MGSAAVNPAQELFHLRLELLITLPAAHTPRLLDLSKGFSAAWTLFLLQDIYGLPGMAGRIYTEQSLQKI